jgi:hypothetical protein
LAVLVVALLLGLAGPALAGEIKGKIMQVDPDRLEFVLQTSAGKMMVFQMDEDAQVLINDKQARLSELRAGDEVTIASRRDGDVWMAIEVRCQRKK